LHGALLTLAIVIVLLPSVRTPPVRATFFVLWFIVCAIGVRDAWRRGHLKLTPKQLFDKSLAGERLISSRLEKAALGIAVVASIVLVMA